MKGLEKGERGEQRTTFKDGQPKEGRSLTGLGRRVPVILEGE